MRLLAAALAIACALARPVSAEPPAPDPQIAKIKGLYEEGMKHFNLRDFKAALAAFKQAYLARPDPAFLFNIGQCHRMLGEWADAEYSYRAYLRNQPDAPNRADVERFIAIAEQERRHKAQSVPPTGTMAPNGAQPTAEPAVIDATTTVVKTEAPTAGAPLYRRWWLWAVVVGVAVVGVAAGVGIAYALPNDAAVPAGAMAIRFH